MANSPRSHCASDSPEFATRRPYRITIVTRPVATLFVPILAIASVSIALPAVAQSQTDRPEQADRPERPEPTDRPGSPDRALVAQAETKVWRMVREIEVLCPQIAPSPHHANLVEAAEAWQSTSSPAGRSPVCCRVVSAYPPRNHRRIAGGVCVVLDFSTRCGCITIGTRPTRYAATVTVRKVNQSLAQMPCRTLLPPSPFLIRTRGNSAPTRRTRGG